MTELDLVWPNDMKIQVIGGAGEYQAGKAQPLSSLVLTPSGFKRMGDVRVGDRVINPDGGTATVQNVFPQGHKDVFKVTFYDGGSARCCREHLWRIQTWNDRSRDKGFRIVNTDAIIRWINQTQQPIYVQLCQPVQFDTCELPLDSYMLGVLLGDGCLTHHTSVSTSANVATKLRPLVEAEGCNLKLKSGVKSDYGIVFGGRGGNKKNPIREKLRELRLFGLGSHEKFIPEQYKLASVADRLSLLNGLLVDTDGSINSHGRIDYSTTSPQLMQDVVEIVRSLGGNCGESRRRKSRFSYKGECRHGRDSYRTYIQLPLLSGGAGVNPRRILSVVSDGIEECRCLLLDSENHLYVTDDYIVTHNTLFGLTIDPTHTICYDWEKSSSIYEGLGFHRLDVPDLMMAMRPSGYKPIDTFMWWREQIRSIPAGKFSVIMVDPVTDIEAGLVDWVRSHPEEFGKTANQYDRASALLWGDVKSHWKTILIDLAARCQVFYFTSHMRDVWKGTTNTGRREPKGKDTLMEIASLYLLLERNPDGKGVVPKVPSARVIKSRLAHTRIVDGQPEVIPILPPYLPRATPAAIRDYILKPADYEKLKSAEKLPDQSLSEDAKLELKASIAAAELETEQLRAGRFDKMKAAAELQRKGAAPTVKTAEQKAAAKAPEAKMEAARQQDSHPLPAEVTPLPPELSKPVKEPPIEPIPPRESVKPENGKVDPETIKTIKAQMADLGMNDIQIKAALAKRGATSFDDLTYEAGEELRGKLWGLLTKGDLSKK